MAPKYDTVVLCAVPAIFLVTGGCSASYASAAMLALVIVVTAIREKQ
jgi:hypothetical protein